MLKRILLPFLFLAAAINLPAQNIGINNTEPGSTLSVNGSMSAGYNNVTTSYTLTGADYVVVFSGTANGIFTLPAALAPGSGNFKGRVYKIKNNSSFQLTVDAAGNEKINTEDVAILQPGSTLEIISTGLEAGSTWEAVSGLPVDGIRKAFQLGGCSSCAAYDLASVNSWVEITKGEYGLLLTTLTGMGAYGATGAAMSTAAVDGFGGATTMTQNFGTMSQVPPGYYPLALSVKTGFFAPPHMNNLHLKLSNTGQTSGYTTFGFSFSGASAPAAQKTYYFVLKRPSLLTPTGAYSNMAIYQASSSQVGYIEAGLVSMAFGTGNTSNPGNYAGFTPLFQVLATGTKGW